MRKITCDKRPPKPEGANILTTYADLVSKSQKFAGGAYNLLVIAGSPGLSKTHTFRHALKKYAKSFVDIEANASPFATYVEMYERRNELVLLDDADQLNDSPSGKRLLKQIGQNDQWKKVSWMTKAMTGPSAPAPQTYWTSSKVCIITNKWEFRGGDVHTSAVEDRGHCYIFDPSALEIHRFVSSWFWDQEIFDSVAKVLPFLRKPSCRLYVKLAEQKAARDDWRKYLLNFLYTEEDTEYHAVRILGDPSYRTTDARVSAFVRGGYGSRATWFRYAADLRERCKLTDIPRIQVAGRPPELTPDPMAPNS